MNMLAAGIVLGIGITIGVQICIIELLSDVPEVDPSIDFDHIDQEDLNHEFNDSKQTKKLKIKMKNKTHYRQGDVLIERIAKIPTTATKQKPSNAIILAHGEVTGHHHCLEVADPADWWKEGEIAPTLEKPSTLAGEIFVSLPNGGAVKHDEHSKIELPAGNYRVSRQREYSPEAIRNVAD